MIKIGRTYRLVRHVSTRELPKSLRIVRVDSVAYNSNGDETEFGGKDLTDGRTSYSWDPVHWEWEELSNEAVAYFLLTRELP